MFDERFTDDDPLCIVCGINIALMLLVGLFYWGTMDKPGPGSGPLTFACIAFGINCCLLGLGLTFWVSKIIGRQLGKFGHVMGDWWKTSRKRPKYEITKRTVIALLSSPSDWTFDRQDVIHKSGLKLWFRASGLVSISGIFDCAFDERQSEQIISAIDMMQSAKLTMNMGKWDDKQDGGTGVLAVPGNMCQLMEARQKECAAQ